MENSSWERHYRRDRSSLAYPDENLVRLLAKFTDSFNGDNITSLDMGCGSGRHIKLMEEMGIEHAFGSDYSIEGLKRSRRFSVSGLVNCSNLNMPFKDESFDVVAAWGSLHYSPKSETGRMISQAHRILKRGGSFFGTLRSENDTYLRRGTHLGNNTWSTDLHDLSGSVVSFFSLNELEELFSVFSDAEFGLMERTVMGNIESRISHWIFSARK